MNKITTDWREATTGITREQALAAGFIEVKNQPNSFYCYEEDGGMQLIEQLDHLDDEFDSPDVHLMPRLDMCNLPTMNKIITFTEYSRAAASTQMESCRGLDYLELGFVGEVCGELCGELIAKSIRGDFKLIDKAPEVRDESGDACWFADTTCVAHGTSLAEMLGEGDDIFIAETVLLRDAVASGFDKLSDYELGKQLAFYSCCVMAFGHELDDLMRNLQLFFAHLVVLLHRYGYTLVDAVNCNVEKLAKRKKRGLIMGSGDHREA